MGKSISYIYNLDLIMNNPQKILITGGAGFIGSNLALKLVKLGINVVVLDNLSTQIHGDDPFNSSLFLSIKDSVKFIYGSVELREDWLKAIDGVDAVVHLAAETGTGQSMYAVENYTSVNVQGTSILLDILANQTHSIKTMVVASSRSIYGEGKYECKEHGVVYPVERKDADMVRGDFEVKCPVCSENVKLISTDEESKIHPSSIYGITKQVQEQMFMVMGKSLNIDAVALRFQNVYGAGQSLSNPYTGILSIFSTRIMNGNDINIFEDGLESRDFVYIDDVVDSIVLALINKKAAGEVYGVGTGECIDVLTVAKTLKDIYQSDSKIVVSGNYRVGDIRHNYADLTKIKSHLGFMPKISFAEGMKRFTAWVKKQSIQTDLYEESIKEMKSKGLYK
jgi:dTDP-L-rhamnose 4-epimerase